MPLLEHYAIKKPLVSFHKFNEAAKTQQIIDDLAEGQSIGLISDAGTPGISDPGSRLIQACISAGIPITPIPGASACIAALSCSGLPTDRFQFYGFLPRTSSALRQALQEILLYPGTTVCYESPHRLMKTLAALETIAPDRALAVARELTKKYEQVARGNASALLNLWQASAIKGEIVLLISGNPEGAAADFEHLSLEDHVAEVQTAFKLSRQDAIKLVAKLRGLQKRAVYNQIEKQAHS